MSRKHSKCGTIGTRHNEIMKEKCWTVIAPDNSEHELFIKIESI